MKKYTEAEIEKIKEELSPLVKMCRENKLPEQKMRRMNKLHDELRNYYTSQKKWNSEEEYFKALQEIDLGGLFFHRYSLAVRALSLRQPELFK